VAFLSISIKRSSPRARKVANRAILEGILVLYTCGLFKKFIKVTRNLEPCIIRAMGMVSQRGKGIK